MTADRARKEKEEFFDHASTSDQEQYPTSKTASGSLFNGKEIASFKKMSTQLLSS